MFSRFHINFSISIPFLPLHHVLVQLHPHQRANYCCLVGFRCNSHCGNGIWCIWQPCLANLDDLSDRRHICGRENSRKIRRLFTIAWAPRAGVGWRYHGVHNDGYRCSKPQASHHLHLGFFRGFHTFRPSCLSDEPTHSVCPKHTGGRGCCMAAGVVVVAPARIVRESWPYCQYYTA